ncbi:hypothetical protein [Allokutzneria albata]|nr:hypothetical protein [Allokutzneria albata]
MRHRIFDAADLYLVPFSLVFCGITAGVLVSAPGPGSSSSAVSSR